VNVVNEGFTKTLKPNDCDVLYTLYYRDLFFVVTLAKNKIELYRKFTTLLKLVVIHTLYTHFQQG